MSNTTAHFAKGRVTHACKKTICYASHPLSLKGINKFEAVTEQFDLCIRFFLDFALDLDVSNVPFSLLYNYYLI